MKEITGFTAQLAEAVARVYAKKENFFGVFTVTFIGSVLVLASFDLLPSRALVHAGPDVVLGTSTVVNATSTPEDPVKIVIPTIGLSATVANPATTDIKTLDQNLLTGAVRYPTSARLGETGNVVIFGHSSYLPVVGNQAYKAFNGIQKLVAGDTITVYSSGTAYTYQVRDVAKESAASDAGINLAVTGRVLTLATCDSFGAKSDRFIVTADFVESHSVSTL
ncbi:MAG: sortase [Candidatus Paceibacterota bacterium]|jgi:LPXTG-site transpeptidase (sortase) family protein